MPCTRFYGGGSSTTAHQFRDSRHYIQTNTSQIVTILGNERTSSVAQPTANGEQHPHPVLQQLHPLLELTPVVRPRFLLGAPVVGVGPILLALLYHRDKDAFQSRLRFHLPGQPQFLRRTKWRTFADAASLHRRRDKILRDFRDLVTKVGGTDMVQVEFPPDASDADVLQRILASAIPSLLPEQH